MNEQNPFIRESLRGHWHRPLDSGGLVETWASHLEDFFDGAWLNGEALAHYDLIANAGKILRARQALRTPYVEAALRRAWEYLAEHSQECIDFALKVPDVAAWRKQLDFLLETIEDPGAEDKAEIDLASRLVSDLDDAQVVWAMSTRFGESHFNLLDELESAESSLLAHEDIALNAAFFVQSIASVVEPTIVTNDPVFGNTAKKFIALLDRIEKALAPANSALSRMTFRRWLDTPKMMVPSARRIIEASWRVPAPIQSLAADDAAPQPFDYQLFRHHESPFSVFGSQDVLIDQQLLPGRWKLRVTIESPQGDALPVLSVHLGSRVAYRELAGNDRVWGIDLVPARGSAGNRPAIDDVLVIQFKQPVTLRITPKLRSEDQ
jgi:hypothetical protein